MENDTMNDTSDTMNEHRGYPLPRGLIVILSLSLSLTQYVALHHDTVHNTCKQICIIIQCITPCDILSHPYPIDMILLLCTICQLSQKLFGETLPMARQNRGLK